MCLTTKNPKLKVATEDITVYKECRDITNEQCTSDGHRHFDYKVNEVTPNVTLEPYSIGSGKYDVQAGYHSYKYPRRHTNTVFVIPKGTSYIDGQYNDNPLIRNRVSSNIKYIGPKKFSFMQIILSRLGIKL